MLRQKVYGVTWSMPLRRNDDSSQGHLSYDYESENLAWLFSSYGTVEIDDVIYNRDTKQSRGFGVVTMSTFKEDDKAVEAYNGYNGSGEGQWHLEGNVKATDALERKKAKEMKL
ncbi:28 kDa ribonucleoprotein, chloroplastic-like protein [Tanacetum coccineum]